jgi:hypothetical protein
MTNQISSTLIGQQGKKPQNNSKHGEGHADHEEAQAGDHGRQPLSKTSESKEERAVHKDVTVTKAVARL